MDNSKPIPIEHNLHLLETIEQNPHVTQADLAARCGLCGVLQNLGLKLRGFRGGARVYSRAAA